MIRNKIQPSTFKQLTHSYKPHHIRIGILGGGQLARMLVIKGLEQGFNMFVLCENETDPAAEVCKNWIKGTFNNIDDLKKLSNCVDLITFESEFIDPQILNQVNGHFFPKISDMHLFQDRLFQKKLFTDKKIPTAIYADVFNFESLNKAATLFNYKFVLKKRFGGYDGYGTYIFKNKKSFLKLAPKINFNDFKYIAETFVPFKNEMACVFFRNSKNEKYHLPLVETHQKNSKCDWVYGPIQHSSFNKIKSQIFKMMEQMNYIGTLAVEFFNYNNQLIVNETAPRVHNSGHYSLNSNLPDQFTLHLKSILGLSFPKINNEVLPFAMVNIIGSSEKPIQFPLEISGHLHWYGKIDNRPGRKMAHINYLSDQLVKDNKSILKKALNERKKIKT